jgi:hypothetical protein
MEVITPEWLIDVKGWVPSAALRRIERTSSGERVFVEADFSWDGDTRKYSKEIATIINQISQENEKCGTIVLWPGSVHAPIRRLPRPDKAVQVWPMPGCAAPCGWPHR